MLPLLKRRRRDGWMAILPQSDSVTLAHVRRRPEGRPEVALLDRYALDGGLPEALARLRKARQLGDYACTTLLAADACTVTQLDAPQVPREERREALRWTLKEMLAYPVESAALDVLDIPSGGAGRPPGVLVVSAPEAAVREHLAPFVAAKVELEAIDIPEMALRNVAALFEDENRALAFFRIDETGMTLLLTYGGELVAARRGEASTRQLTQCEGDQCQRLRERLVLDLQRSLDNFDRQYGQFPVSKVLFSCSPPLPDLADELRENVYVPLVELDLAQVIDFGAAPELADPLRQAQYLPALGAALRSAPTGGPA